MLRRIRKYNSLLVKVPFLMVKYTVLKFVLSSKTFFQLVDVKNNKPRKAFKKCIPMQPKDVLLRQINRVTSYLSLSKNCLIDSLVKRDILAQEGYKVTINLSIYKNNNNAYKTHAWIENPGMDSYKTLYKI